MRGQRPNGGWGGSFSRADWAPFGPRVPPLTVASSLLAAPVPVAVNVLTETEPSPEDFSQTQADCLSPFGLHRLRHDYKTNLCGYLVYDGSEPVAYSRMIRSGGSGGSAGLLTDSKDGACAVQTAADNAITSCRCDHPSSSGHRQAGFTCHTTKGDIAWTHRANCSSGAHCASATPWDASFRPPPCVDSSLGRGGRRLAGANNQTVLVTVVTHTATIAGTVDSFDAAAYKHNLAAALEGVSPADISLDLAPASVRAGGLEHWPGRIGVCPPFSLLTRWSSACIDRCWWSRRSCPPLPRWLRSAAADRNEPPIISPQASAPFHQPPIISPQA